MTSTVSLIPDRGVRRVVLGVLAGVLAVGAVLVHTPQASAALPPIQHVFVLIDENESASTTFGADSPAPYLSKTLTAEGAYLPNYYGTGHNSLDNYIAMVSGQAPNDDTSSDCGTFAEFAAPLSMGSYGQENGEGCIYPADVPTIMSQLDAAGLTWRAYEDDMPTACDHPASGAVDPDQGEDPTNQYATRHDPFVYFHYVIDNTAECGADVVNLSQLPTDLASASTTPNYVFITPDVCDDGHDAVCANGGPGGLAQADTFLKTYVPMITSSPAFQQNGLLIVTFDEASTTDATACCGEIPGPGEAEPGLTGLGGGDVGAVLLSPYISPGTVSDTAYNHYSMLGSIENIFGLPHIGYAQLPGETYFGSDIFTNPNGNGSTTTTTTTPTTPTPTTTTTPTTPASPTTPAAAPRDSALTLKPSSFRPARTAKGQRGHGTTVGYTDTEAARTKLVVDRVSVGYRIGQAACRVQAPGKRRPAHAKRCTVTRAAGSFSHQDTAGRNQIAFAGWLRGHALAAGSYTLAITPTIGAETGTTLGARFQVT